MYRMVLFLVSIGLIYYGVTTISEHLGSSLSGFGDKEYVIGSIAIALGLLNFLNIIDA